VKPLNAKKIGSQNLGESYDEKKHCAEKYYTKALAKLFLEKGRSLQIIDACNVMLYPYKKHAFYGDRPGALDSTVNPPFPDNMLINISEKDAIYMALTRSCLSCQYNKETILKILKHAQEIGETAKQKNAPPRELSPLRNSITTRSSLLSPHDNDHEEDSRSRQNIPRNNRF
jgi:hypothetical protein